MKGRVLFLTTDYSAFAQPVSRALRDLDYDVKIFDYQKGDYVSRIVGAGSNFFKIPHDWSKPLIRKRIQKSFLSKVAQWKPNVVLIIKGETIEKESLWELKRQGIITINWYPDWLVLWDWVHEHVDDYTFFVSSCWDLYKKLQKTHKQAYYLPYAADPDKILRKSIKKYPITFIGQYSPRREEYFKEIVDLGLRIWGYSGWQKSSLASIAGPAVSNEKALQILRESKITVNILTGGNDFQPQTVNVRTFETLGVGTFLLVHDRPILHKHFDVNKVMGKFKTPKDLRRKAEYFLKHEQERENIAISGWKAVRKEHTYQKRLKELFTMLKI